MKTQIKVIIIILIIMNKIFQKMMNFLNNLSLNLKKLKKNDLK